MLGTLAAPRLPRLAVIAAAVLGVEWARDLGERNADWSLLAFSLGGVALCGVGLTVPRHLLGLSLKRLGWRLAAGVAIGAVLLLPAVARGAALPGLPPVWLLPAAVVAAGEEIAFRGALFAALEEAFGPAVAVVGSSTAFVLGHVLTHPPSFLPVVAALGLLLGLWRWACRDLVAPITAHVLADLAL